MEEKIYKTMGSTGAASLAVGICVLTGGIAAGILLIVNGARLLKNRAKKPYFSFFHFRQQEVPDLALGDGI